MNVIKGKGPIINPGVCRCCGAVKKCRILNVEYVGLDKKEVYSDMFMDCFGLMLSHMDGEPEDRLICATCVTRLREASCFRQQVLECEEKVLKSKIEICEDSKISDINIDNLQFVNQDLYFGQMDGTDMLDHDYNVPEIEAMENTIFEKIDKIESSDSETTQESIKKPTVKKLGVNLKTKMETQVKKKRIKGNQVKAQHIRDNKMESPDKEAKSKINFTNDKCLLNMITVIENSYVCPFNSFFNNYYCFYCRQKFVDCRKLREHNMAHDPTTYKEVLLNNFRRENKKCQIDMYRIDCRLCDEKIENIDAFKYHISVVHGITVNPVKEDFLKFRLTPTNLKCTECDKTFSFFHALKKHMAEHFGACICDVCGVHYFEERMLIAHMKSHQPSDATFPCKQCGKTFKSKYNMYIHISRLHTKEAAYLCSKCDETFFSDTLRQRHMTDVHGEESLFKCEHCDKVYVSKKTLRDHNRRIHLKLLKHQCNLCDKRFYLPCRLKEHMSSHTGERNFRCEHCGKSYPRLRALKVHMQSHSSEKKYKCTLCNASYSQNVCLKNHMKRQHQNLESEESY